MLALVTSAGIFPQQIQTWFTENTPKHSHPPNVVVLFEWKCQNSPYSFFEESQKSSCCNFSFQWHEGQVTAEVRGNHIDIYILLNIDKILLCKVKYVKIEHITDLIVYFTLHSEAIVRHRFTTVVKLHVDLYVFFYCLLLFCSTRYHTMYYDSRYLPVVDGYSNWLAWHPSRPSNSSFQIYSMWGNCR